eukprot:3263290-Prymnesium_polylepis.1
MEVTSVGPNLFSEDAVICFIVPASSKLTLEKVASPSIASELISPFMRPPLIPEDASIDSVTVMFASARLTLLPPTSNSNVSKGGETGVATSTSNGPVCTKRIKMGSPGSMLTWSLTAPRSTWGLQASKTQVPRVSSRIPSKTAC